MKIQYKLAFIEIAVAAGFSLAIAAALAFTGFARNLKDMEYQVGVVSSSLEKLGYFSKTLLTSAKSLEVLSGEFKFDVREFEKELKVLASQRGLSLLGKESLKEYNAVTGWWKQLKDWNITPEIKYIDEMITNGYSGVIGKKGIMHAYFIHKHESSELVGKVLSLMNYQDNYLGMAEVFQSEITAFTKKISNRTDAMVRNGYLLAIGIVIITVLFSVFIVSLVAWRISMRIRLVEDAIRTVAKGDFSRDLVIKSGDEFEELSKHYNAFKTELWKKLGSVLDFMIDISVSLSSGLDIDFSVKKILSSMIRNSSADAGAVFMLNEETLLIEMKAVEGDFPCPYEIPESVAITISRQIEYMKEHKITLGRTIVGDVVKSGEGLYIKNSADSEYLKNNSFPGSLQYISSIGVIPLVITRRVLGAVVLVKTTAGDYFSDVEFSNMKTFGDYAALTIDNLYNFTENVQRVEMERELNIAASIQKKLLPEKLPELTGFSVGVFSRSAEAVSSDYYDVFKLSKERAAVVMCDVVGKGVPASLLMVMIRTMIRIVAPSAKDSDHLLRIVNKGLRTKIGVDQYATMGVIIVNEKDSRLSYSNAAHTPLLHYNSADNTFIQIDSPGLPIGVEPEEKYGLVQLKPTKGDLYILYTDGVLESRNEEGSLYPMERLQDVIRENLSLPGRKIAEAVLADISSFLGDSKRVDDQTFLVLKHE